MKIKANVKDCHLFVKVKLSFGEKLDEKEFDAFSRKYTRGFLKQRKIKGKEIEYSGPIGISLRERLQKPISRRDFLFLIEHIMMVIQNMHANEMSIQNVLLDIDYVYINEVTKELQFIYLPATIKDRATSLIKFIEDIIYSAQPVDEKTSEIISEFAHFMKNLVPFDTDKIEKFVMSRDKSVVNIIKKNNLGQSGFMTDKQQHYYEHYNSEDDDTDLLEEDDDTAYLDDEDDELTGLLVEEDDDTGLLNEEEEDTALLNEPIAPIFPKLCRVKTQELVEINKPSFRIGKGQDMDYCVWDNNMVSRTHAEIILRGQNYFVKDLESKNHTYVNGQMIEVGNEVEIRDGDTIRLADEEFNFRAE